MANSSRVRDGARASHTNRPTPSSAAAPPPRPAESTLSTLQAETKACRETLQKALDAHDVRSRNAQLEFARKALRSRFLLQLFQHTFSSRTRGIETHIWIATSHPLVHQYRSNLSSLEARIKNTRVSVGADPITTAGATRNGLNASDAGSSTEPARLGKQRSQQQLLGQLSNSYNRVNQDFRTFLTEEEAFWRVLARRIVLMYHLDDAMSPLEAMESILTAEDRAAETSADSIMERVIVTDSDSDMLRITAEQPANRQRLLEIVHKSFVCCGDLARYREQYRDESQYEPRAKLANNKRSGRGGRGAKSSRENSPTISTGAKDYTRAALCYTQARHLVPSNGNPWNQLAVLATYRNDVFSSVYFYFRALCVREPFEKARQNLEKTLSKALDKWELSTQSGQAADTTKDSVSAGKALYDLVVLHAGFEKKKRAVLTSRLPEQCLKELSTVIYDRQLGADALVEVIVTAIAALWLRRLGRGNSPAPETNDFVTSTTAEQSILRHLCGLMRLFFEMCHDDTEGAMEAEKDVSVPLPTLSSANVSRRLTPTVRRMLPALRILSKWLKGHIDYLQRMTAQASQETGDSSAIVSGSIDEVAPESGVEHMWRAYAECVNVLRYAFPFDCLPNVGIFGQSGLSLDFEEDGDMRGFLPMKKSMQVDEQPKQRARGPSAGSLDPREDHLTRIADLLIDAKIIAETETSGIVFDDVNNSFSTQTRSVIDVTDIDGESSEDAVDLAMRAMHEQPLGSTDVDDDDDEDEVILVPQGAPRPSSLYFAPTESPLRPPDVATTSTAPAGEPLTAQHLFLQMINGKSSQPTSGEASPTWPSQPISALNAAPGVLPRVNSNTAWPLPASADAQRHSAIFGATGDIWAPLGSAPLPSAGTLHDAQSFASGPAALATGGWPDSPRTAGDASFPSNAGSQHAQTKVTPW